MGSYATSWLHYNPPDIKCNLFIAYIFAMTPRRPSPSAVGSASYTVADGAERLASFFRALYWSKHVRVASKHPFACLFAQDGEGMACASNRRVSARRGDNNLQASPH